MKSTLTRKWSQGCSSKGRKLRYVGTWPSIVTISPLRMSRVEIMWSLAVFITFSLLLNCTCRQLRFFNDVNLLQISGQMWKELSKLVTKLFASPPHIISQLGNFYLRLSKDYFICFIFYQFIFGLLLRWQLRRMQLSAKAILVCPFQFNFFLYSQLSALISEEADLQDLNLFLLMIINVFLSLLTYRQNLLIFDRFYKRPSLPSCRKRMSKSQLLIFNSRSRDFFYSLRKDCQKRGPYFLRQAQGFCVRMSSIQLMLSQALARRVCKVRRSNSNAYFFWFQSAVISSFFTSQLYLYYQIVIYSFLLKNFSSFIF